MKHASLIAIAGLALAAFTAPVFGQTTADSAAMTNLQTKAKLDAALVAGSSLRSSDGAMVGKVKSINADGSVLIETPNQTFSLSRELFGTDDKGLILLITSQQLNEALKKIDQPSR